MALGAAHGNVLDRHPLGGPVAQAAIQAPLDLAVPHEHADPEAPAETGLTALARVADERLTGVRVIAARALALIPGVEATRSLVTIASDPSVPDEVRAAAGDALSGRTDGVRIMLDALDTHYDYYRRTVAPPVGVLARALAAVHEHRAVAPLIAHLQDPYTPANQLQAIVAALRDLGDPTVLPALLDFVTIYHADDGAVTPVGGGTAIDDVNPRPIERGLAERAGNCGGCHCSGRWSAGAATSGVDSTRAGRTLASLRSVIGSRTPPPPPVRVAAHASSSPPPASEATERRHCRRD